MSNLNTFMKIAKSGATRELSEQIPAELTTVYDGELKNVRELLLSTDVGATNLIQTEVLDTIISGADQMKCMRDALPIYGMNTKTMEVNVGSATTYASVFAEGAEIPIETDVYSAVEFKAQKFATRPMISNELVADASADIISAELRKAGGRIENALNQVAITKMIDGAGLNVDCNETAASQGIVAISNAIAAVQAAGFMPNSIVMHPKAYALLVQEMVPGNYATETLASGAVGKILGLDVFVCGVTDASASSTWSFGANGEIGMLIFDKENAAAIGMREDISVSEFEDPIRDMTGMVVKSRFDVEVLNAKAICKVIY